MPQATTTIHDDQHDKDYTATISYAPAATSEGSPFVPVWIDDTPQPELLEFGGHLGSLFREPTSYGVV